MGEFRRDPISGRWVIIASENERAPKDPYGPKNFTVELNEKLTKTTLCPFCMGNEDKTPPEVFAVRKSQTKPNKSGWSVRVVSNKFPALKIEGELDRLGIGVYDMMNGIGAHEVIIETPHHNKQMADLKEGDLENVLHAYRQRAVDLSNDKRFRYILIFKNYGLSAGASLEHSHTQLIALPIIPKRVNAELIGALKHFEYKERCIFCDMIRQELEESERIISENKTFLAFTPFASCFPYECWILPKIHNASFAASSDNDLHDLARIVKDILKRLKSLFKDPAYNFIIHSTPTQKVGNHDEYHWHIELMPKLVRTAGFEWGSGFYINPVLPENAAKYLREVKV